MLGRLYELQQQKTHALQHQQQLLLQIHSQSDPKWIEMLLKRELGMVQEGQVKVYFHSD